MYIYIYMQSPPQNLPFQYSHLSRVQPSHAFVDVTLSFCRWEWWTLHCTAMHCIVLQSGGTDLAWIMRDSARAVPPGLGESRPGLDVAGKLEVSILRCDEQWGGILQCDALVGPCIREPTKHLLHGAPAWMRRARGWHHPALRCPCRPLRQRADKPPPGAPAEMRRARGWHHPAMRCPCLPLHQRRRQTTSRCPL